MAALKNKATRKTRAATLEPTPRHLWLAALGVLVAGRRESLAAAKRAATRVENTIADARYALRRAEADLRAGVDGVRSQVEPRVQKLSGDVEARLAPIIAKLGLKPKTTRKARKPRKTATKAVRRRTRTGSAAITWSSAAWASSSGPRSTAFRSSCAGSAPSCRAWRSSISSARSPAAAI